MMSEVKVVVRSNNGDWNVAQGTTSQALKMGSGIPGGIRLASNNPSQQSATINRTLLILTVALAHFALTLGAVALALWFTREPDCSTDDECDCTDDDCRTVVLKVEATSVRYERSTL